MEPLNLDNLTKYEEDPILPLLDTFDTFSDLTFDFNGLIETEPVVETNQNTLAYVNEILDNQNIINNKIILSQSNELNILEDFLNDSTFETPSYSTFQLDSNFNSSSSYYLYSQSTNSNSGSPGTVYEQSTGTPEQVTEDPASNENSLEDECEKFLAETYDFGTADVKVDGIEIIVDTANTCVDMRESDADSDDDSDCRNDIEKFRLTEEEKSVFIKEGYKIPTHVPLTKSEEKLLKLVRRKIRNKKSAHNSRERKKKYIDGLEKRVEYCTKMNQELQKENKLLKNQNIQLVTKLKNMQKCMNEMFKKHKRTSTAMLFISFLLMFFVYPGGDSNETEVTKYESKYQTLPFKGYSRTLLSSDLNMSSLTPLDSGASAFEKLLSYYKDRYDL